MYPNLKAEMARKNLTLTVIAKVLNSESKNPALRYRIKSLPIRIKLLLKYLKSPFMYKPLLRKLVMKSGLLSISVIEE